MASEANTRKAEELLTRKRCPDYCQDCEACQLDRQMVALAMDAAEQRGRESVLAPIERRTIEQGIVGALVDYDAVVSELRRLRRRIEAEAERQLDLRDEARSRGARSKEGPIQHESFAHVLRSLLTDPDQQESQESEPA